VYYYSLSDPDDPDANKEDGQSPSTHHTIGGRPVHVCQPGAHSQEIVPLFNNHFSVVYWPGQKNIPLHYVCKTFYEFINPSRELILSILDKTHVIS
jgi:hypothetical protein